MRGKLSIHNMGLRDLKMHFLVDVATELFMSQSIQDVTIKDIATKAQVGEATVYRYFGTKQKLVVLAAMKLQDIVNSDYFKPNKDLNGFENLETFYQSYLKIFKKHPGFYKFLNEFDIYMSGDRSGILDSYEEAIDQYKNIFMTSYEEGLKDGSVVAQKDIDLFYFTTTHSMIELCKKLSLKAVLNQDLIIKKENEIKCLIEIILTSLRK